ncbi:glycosyltransferase family A protein [Streptomyces sp. NPDC047017]|uniref:glycosyltransferase family 2 protein n=1 Tax=Streptomyces sp. NPDC047017 TaxID=3155024 RepID=UPI0034061123
MPRVTVICPTYNRSTALRRTLDSVRCQSVRDWELLVVSDGSTDDTDAVARAAAREDPRVRLIRTERHGHPSGPRNAGLAEGRGEVVAYLDHDDRWRPDHLLTVLTAVGTGAELVATGHQSHDRHGRVTAVSEPLGLCWHPEFQVLAPMFEPSRVAHLRGLAERAGGWRAGPGLEDWDLWVRMADSGARFTTVTAPTALLLDDTATRRHRTARPHRLPLAEFDDPRRARAFVSQLNDPLHDEEFRAACEADLRAWFRRLLDTPDFVLPLDRPDVRDTGVLDTEIARLVRATAPLWPDLVVVPRRGGAVVAQRLWCATTAHATRIRELARRSHARQFALLAELAVRPARDSAPDGGLAVEATARPTT